MSRWALLLPVFYVTPEFVRGGALPLLAGVYALFFYFRK